LIESFRNPGRRFINHHNARKHVGRNELQRATSASNIEKANAALKDPRSSPESRSGLTSAPSPKAKFLSAYARRAIKSRALKIAGVSRKTVNRWLDEDPQFAAAYEDAYETACDRTEEKMADVAFVGVPKTIFNSKTGESTRT
jgi:hypothetical protein